MSCQIRLTANIHDVQAIRRCLFPTDDSRGTDNWLQYCEISASPTGDIIAIAKERRLVVLTSKWDSNSGLSLFQITYSGTIHEYDKVKAIVCLPIVRQSQSSHVGPDWTCILVGYDSGYVRFYTENCELLLEEQLHCENICSIKCQSQHNPRPDISPDLHPEEIYIQYQSNVNVLNGNQLFSILRTCRSQLAKVQAKSVLLETTSHDALSPRKWGFQDQSVINDTSVVGWNLCSTFDHLMTASICGGFDTKYRAMPPHNTLVLAAGSKPFVGYHYALEGGSQPVFSDVAKAVASKLKSALPGWLTGSKTQVEKQMTVAMQPVETMGCRFGLCDLRRTATEIVLSSDHKLAAVCDTLGRVLLIDAFKGIVLRIFKGYRDAQCAFIQVPDERKSKHRHGNRIALFLVIYSSRKGILEIFSAQEGIKIVTFTASKCSRLLYINYGLFGFTTTSKSRYICQFTTIFIDNDGSVKEFLIPFHFSLSEKNNKRARDIHLHKKLKLLIKTEEFSEEQLENEAYNTCVELKTLEIKLQTIEMLLGSKNVPAEITLKCVQYFMENLKDDLDPEYNNFKIFVDNVGVLLKFYLFTTTSKDDLDEENGNSQQQGSCTSLQFDSALNLGAKELENLQKLLDLGTLIDNEKDVDVKVSFFDTKEFFVSNFVSIFDLTDTNNIRLKSNLDDQVLFKASEILFKSYVADGRKSDDDFKEEIIKSKIIVKDFFKLLMNYWVNRSLYMHLNLEKEMNHLSQVIYTLVKTASKEDIVAEYNINSKFWTAIREILANSSRPFPALTAAILCKNIAQKIEKEREMEMSATSLEDDNMEMMSQENCQWDLLIGKLEDVSLLNIILSGKPKSDHSVLPKLNHDKVDVSLKYILEKGKGSVSELVAQWLSRIGLNPELILANDVIYKTSQEGSEQQANSNDLDEKIKEQVIFEHINLLKVQFPYSLDASALLSNMSWEYSLAWQKDIQQLEILDACIKCLKFIPNVQIKMGLCNLLWNTHLKILYESICKLINKVGKLPKEKLCRQDTGLSDFQITLFTGICTAFLDEFMDFVQECYNKPPLQLNFEPIWENGSQPLIELAAQQREVNYDLLHLHYQLSLVLQMMATLAIKHSKPVNNLFDSSCTNLFFTNLKRNCEINWNLNDAKRNASRTQFLLKIISASLETVIINEGKIYSSEHVAWMSKCLTLGRFWNLNLDEFKRFQVIQLFFNGFDTLAEELMPAIKDRKELGRELLPVSAKRLLQYLTASPDLSENISALSPALSQYLETLNGEWCASCPLSGITNLAAHTLRNLSEDQSEYKMAQQLLEACTTLEEIQS